MSALETNDPNVIHDDLIRICIQVSLGEAMREMRYSCGTVSVSLIIQAKNCKICHNRQTCPWLPYKAVASLPHLGSWSKPRPEAE